MELSHSLLYSSLYAHSNIRRLHLKLDSLSWSVGSVKSFLGDSVRPSARVTFFSSPRHRVHSEKYIRREKERGRKKRQLAVCTRSFLSGRRRVAQEIRWNFAQNGKRAAGVLGYANSEIRDFMNDKTSGWAASSSKGRSDNAMEKDRDIGKESQASQRTSEPVTAWPYN